MKIDDIMFKYMLQNEEGQQVNVQAAERDHLTGPPSTPSTPIQANSPIYHQPFVSTTVVSITGNTVNTIINCFPTQQESDVNQNSILQACLITISYQT